MKYAIISQSHIHSMQSGLFNHLDRLFYRGRDSERKEFTKYVHQARFFDNEQEAWFHAYDIFGMDFSKAHFLIVCVHDEAIDQSKAVAERNK